MLKDFPLDQPITAWYCLSITQENIRKPLAFLMFSGGIDKQHRAVMGNSAVVTIYSKKVALKLFAISSNCYDVPRDIFITFLTCFVMWFQKKRGQSFPSCTNILLRSKEKQMRFIIKECNTYWKKYLRMISLRKYSLITDKHNQKLIKILENQKINGGFLKILIFRVSLPRTHLLCTHLLHRSFTL